MRILKGIILFFTFLALSGCLSMNEREKKEYIMAAPPFEKAVKQGLESKVFVSGDFPDKKWWESFQSPALSEWIETAFSQNPSLQAVQRRLEQAKETAKLYRSKLFPTLFFNGKDNVFDLSQHEVLHLLNPSLPRHGYEVGLAFAFNYEFDFWNKNRNLFRSALGEVKAWEAEVEEAKLILSTSLAQAYFTLLIQREKKKLYQALQAVRTRTFYLEKRLGNSALLSDLPLFSSDERVQEASQLVLQAQNDIEVQKHFIQVLRGQSPEEDIEIEQLFLKEPPHTLPLPEHLSLHLLARRPDLMAQIWRAEALSFQVSAARADFFPDINLMALAGVKSIAWDTLFQLPSKSLSLLPTFSLPLYTAGAIRAGVQRKKASFEEAIFSYNALLLQSVQQVADLLSNLKTVYEQKGLQNQVLQDAKARLFLVELRKQSGLDSTFPLLDAEEEVIQKQLVDLDLLYYQYIFMVRFIKALGGGFLSPSLPISKEEGE